MLGEGRGTGAEATSQERPHPPTAERRWGNRTCVKPGRVGAKEPSGHGAAQVLGVANVPLLPSEN